MEKYAGLERKVIAAKRLKTFGEPSGGWGDYIPPRHGGPSLKYLALEAARSYLRAVGKALIRTGMWEPYRGRAFGKTGITLSKGGPAVSGEAIACFVTKAKDSDVAVYLQISPDAVNRLGIMWRRTTKDRPFGGHHGPGFRNIWANKNTTAEDLARKIADTLTHVE